MKIIVLLVVCTLPCACMAWSVIPLEPQQFSAEKSPDEVRLILNDSTRVTAQRPVLVGDSLVWTDSERRAIAVSNIQRVEVQKTDEGGTAFLLLLIAGVVAGVLAFAKAVTVE